MAKTPQPARSRITSAILWIFGLLVILLVAYSIHTLTRSAVAVHVGSTQFETIASTVSTNGKVEPMDEFQAHAPSPGIIQKVLVSVGAQVRPGQLLVTMDASDARKQLAAAQSNVAAAQSALADIEHGGSTEDRGRFSSDIASARAAQQDAASGLAVEKSLQAKGSASAGEVDAAQQKLDAANFTLHTAQGRTSGRYSTGDRAAAQARLADARAGVSAAQGALSAVDMRSPIAGTVYAVPVSQYDFVPAGDDLADVADLNHVQVRAYFDEPEIGKLARNQPVVITWEAKPGTAWNGHIVQPPTTVITYGGTRNVGECLISVDDAHGGLLPNTNVTVKVTEAEHAHVLTIPREALHTDAAGPYVFRIVSGKLVRISVVVGLLNNSIVEITSGLAPNDAVVLGPAESGNDLVPGQQVKPVS